MDSLQLRSRNARVVAAARAAGWTADAALTLLCECASAHCEAMIPLTPRQHETRSLRAWFAVAPGHVDEAVRPVETGARFWLVDVVAPA